MRDQTPTGPTLRSDDPAPDDSPWHGHERPLRPPRPGVGRGDKRAWGLGGQLVRRTNGNDQGRVPNREIERYRRAAIHALGQLEWVVGYLHRIHKAKLARALDRNRKQILERLP
jgi:hypothetical protein